MIKTPLLSDECLSKHLNLYGKNTLNIKLSAPAHRALAGAGIKTLKDFTKFSEKEITALHGVGPNVMTEIKTNS